MTMNCSQIDEMVAGLPLVVGCDQMRDGALRMSTPFRYPNGEQIDIFIESEDTLWKDFYLSDNGQTAVYLRNAQVLLDTTARRKEVVSDILSRSGVKFRGSQLIIWPQSRAPKEVSEAIFELSQACVRISDLATHQRLRSANPFRDDVEEFFESHNLIYRADIKLPPVFGKREIRIDFEVTSGNKSSYVNILAAMNEAAAHASATEIATKLRDLKDSGQMVMQQFVTIYNSASEGIRIEDIERLRTLSNAISYPEEIDGLLEVLSDHDVQPKPIWINS